MKTISGIIGLVLILVAVIIILLSTGEDSFHAKKEAIVQKYIQNSSKALEENNIEEALKFAQMAIQADPKNYAGFTAYDNVMKSKYKPKEIEHLPTSTKISSPVDDEDEEDDSGRVPVGMGC